MSIRTIAALAALSLSTLSAQAIEIETATGPVEISGAPEKIAVFDIAAIDTLDRIGVRISGLPTKLYISEFDRLKQGAETVGDIFEPDLEALSALAPDLVIVGGRSSTKLDAVRKVAPAVDMTLYGEDLIAQAKQRLATYGALFARQAAAEKAAAELDARIAAAKAAITGKGKALIIMTNGPKVTAYGPGSRFGWVHAALDLPAAVPDVEAANHGEAVSFEFIAKANPDWLLVLDRAAAIGSGEQGARATLDNELVAGTTAWKKGQVIYLPSAQFYIAAGGIQSTEKVLAVLTEAFAAAK